VKTLVYLSLVVFLWPAIQKNLIKIFEHLLYGTVHFQEKII